MQDYYIARDIYNNAIYIYRGKPKKEKDKFIPHSDCMRLCESDFPNITFENSPVKVNIILETDT